MDGGLNLADFHRLMSLARKFRDKRYRDGYVAAHTRGVLARQMRNFRGDFSQAQFAEEVGKQKTMVARLENPAYGGWSLRTMLEIARNRDVAVFCRFVDFSTFLRLTSDLSDEALHPPPYDQHAIDQLADREKFRSQEQALKALFSQPSDDPRPLKALDGMQVNNIPRASAANDDNAMDTHNSILSAFS